MQIQSNTSSQCAAIGSHPCGGKQLIRQGFFLQSVIGQRTTLCPKLDLVVVRLGQTAPHKVGHVVAFNKAIVDAFRPTAA